MQAGELTSTAGEGGEIIVTFDLENYNTVAERIEAFFKKYPDGRLKQVKYEFLVVEGKHYLTYTAAALRTADDPSPGEGTAWEPVPGRTPYTRDSEMQNAETSAWGRAIIAVGAADTRKGIASREEVQNRNSAPEEAPLSEAQVARRQLWDLCKEHGRSAKIEEERFRKDIGVRIVDSDADTIRAYTAGLADEIAAAKEHTEEGTK